MAIDIRGMAPLLEVFDMPTSVAFYCDVLGFQVVMDDGKPVPHNDWVCLEHSGVHVMLNTMYEGDSRPSERETARTRAHRDTCLYFACPDPDAAYAHLRSKGLDLKPPELAPYGMKQLYMTDPDNYNLCFQWRADKGAAS